MYVNCKGLGHTTPHNFRLAQIETNLQMTVDRKRGFRLIFIFAFHASHRVDSFEGLEILRF